MSAGTPKRNILFMSHPLHFPDSSPPRRQIRYAHVVFFVLLLFSVGMGALGGLVFVHTVDLPQVRLLEDYRPDVITEIYGREGSLIGTFALERRILADYEGIPVLLQDAILSVEDRNFWDHWGVDVGGVARAALMDILRWRLTQGASTITQQLSRILFLSPDKRFRRKLEEALLAVQIERHFTKAQIFTLYCNQIYLGSGNYGFQAAARFNFQKDLAELTLPEAALLAGLPQAPSAYAPLRHPERAKRRRNIVLRAMQANGKITAEEAAAALAAPLGLNPQEPGSDLGLYFIEEIRKQLEDRYGKSTVHEQGLRVHTTLDPALQQAAEQAVRFGLHRVDKRRGWRGVELNILQDPPRLENGKPATLETYRHRDWKRPVRAGDSVHGLVTQVTRLRAQVKIGDRSATLSPAGFAWTGRTDSRRVLKKGDIVLLKVVRIVSGQPRITLDQRPEVQGALVALENHTGRILAMVGGYDFRRSQFNRTTQALRQAGSSFKPYLYTAALLGGFSPFDTVVDEPTVYTKGLVRPWSPQNYDRRFKGEITLLQALAESRNVPAVKLIDQVGIPKVVSLSEKLGIASPLVPNLPLALGASEVLLLEHTSAFSVFPNDGIRAAPYSIEKVVSYHGALLEEHRPQMAEVLPAPVARLMVSMLREVVRSGTARRVQSLNLPLAGKTGTTNDYSDAAFIGFSPTVTCSVWVGLDNRETLGSREEGARVALPIWMDFMREAAKVFPAGGFPHSPLLDSPEQVEAILLSDERRDPAP